VLGYCQALASGLSAQSAFNDRVRVLLIRATSSLQTEVDWVRRGAPIMSRSAARCRGRTSTYMRRDKLRDGDKVRSSGMARDQFLAEAPLVLAEISGSASTRKRARGWIPTYARHQECR